MRNTPTSLCVILILFCNLWFSATCFAQEEGELNPEKTSKLINLKVAGYVQFQYQHGGKDALLRVGGVNENSDKSFDRIGIRRGRIKFIYEEGIASGVFQLDMTEKSVVVKDVYINLKFPWAHTNAFRLGICNRPFGYEVSYSSSLRESPERSTVIFTLFPEERDLGAMTILQMPKKSKFHFLKLEAGFFAGNGIKQETDSKRDFIGHLSANKNIGKKIDWGLGVSYYNGSVYQGSANVYTMDGNGFVLNDDPDNMGKFAKREYFGFDGQFQLKTQIGEMQFRMEYLFGTQPGGKSNSISPNSSVLSTDDTYIRKFNGGYIMFIQGIGKLPLSGVLKYDWYDPNTQVSKDEIGLNETSTGDISQNTIGIGIIWQATKVLKLMSYYEINKNEHTTNLANFNKDLVNNIFTLRLQYKF